MIIIIKAKKEDMVLLKEHLIFLEIKHKFEKESLEINCREDVYEMFLSILSETITYSYYRDFFIKRDVHIDKIDDEFQYAKPLLCFFTAIKLREYLKHKTLIKVEVFKKFNLKGLKKEIEANSSLLNKNEINIFDVFKETIEDKLMNLFMDKKNSIVVVREMNKFKDTGINIDSIKIGYLTKVNKDDFEYNISTNKDNEQLDLILNSYKKKNKITKIKTIRQASRLMNFILYSYNVNEIILEKVLFDTEKAYLMNALNTFTEKFNLKVKVINEK